MNDQTPPQGKIRYLFPDGPSSDAEQSSGEDLPAADVTPASEEVALEQSVLALRETGRSYAHIARRLQIPRAVEAQAAFVRAVRNHSGAERADLVQRELGRLEVLEKKIREGGEQDPQKTEQRLGALEKLRSALG